MTGYIDPPGRMPMLLRLGTWVAEQKTGKPLLIARILSWYPKAATAAGVMESLVAHEEGKATARLLKLVRMQVSFTASCPFCIDMNSAEFAGAGITSGEIEALQEQGELGELGSFSPDETLALRYARALTATPVSMDSALLRELLDAFSERELVVLVSTIAQVNFWTRLVQGLGVPPEGFSDSCSALRLDDYATLDRDA